MRLTAGRAAVLGRPVAHSLSPVLHTAAYRALGLDWTYEAIDCGVEDLPGVLAARADWAGFSCTMPLKAAVLDAAARVAPVARIVGVGNTLLPGPHGWTADNTDVAGIVAALAEHNLAPSSVLVLGAGGTAQASLASLLALGARAVTVLTRHPDRAGGVRDVGARLGLPVEVGALRPDEPLPAADLVISTLPPRAADTWARAVPWRPGTAVLDVAYDPWPSALAAAAAEAGATVVSGALMLLHQAAAQVSLMTGHEAPVAEMRLALDAAAPGCGV